MGFAASDSASDPGSPASPLSADDLSSRARAGFQSSGGGGQGPLGEGRETCESAGPGGHVSQPDEAVAGEEATDTAVEAEEEVDVDALLSMAAEQVCRLSARGGEPGARSATQPALQLGIALDDTTLNGRGTRTLTRLMRRWLHLRQLDHGLGLQLCSRVAARSSAPRNQPPRLVPRPAMCQRRPVGPQSAATHPRAAVTTGPRWRRGPA